jgi:hypothetical protein
MYAMSMCIDASQMPPSTKRIERPDWYMSPSSCTDGGDQEQAAGDGVSSLAFRVRQPPLELVLPFLAGNGVRSADYQDE